MSEKSSALQEREDWFGRQHLKALGFDESFAKKVRQRIEEGLDATSVKVFQYEGVVIADEERVDYDARHKYTELASKLLDWHPSKIEHEVHGEIGLTINGLNQDGV